MISVEVGSEGPQAIQLADGKTLLVVPSRCASPTLLAADLNAAAGEKERGGDVDRGEIYRALALSREGMTVGELEEFVRAGRLNLARGDVADLVLAGRKGGWLEVEPETLTIKALYRVESK